MYFPSKSCKKGEFSLKLSPFVNLRLETSEDYHVYVGGQKEIQVKMILTWFDSQFPLSSNPNFS